MARITLRPMGCQSKIALSRGEQYNVVEMGLSTLSDSPEKKSYF